MYSSSKLSFMILLIANVSCIPFVDNDVKCRCGFEVDLNTNNRQLWVDNIIEDDGIIDYCDNKGENDCADYCRNQFSPNQNMIIPLHVIPKGYSIPLGEIICGRLADNMVDFKQAKLISTLVCKTKYLIVTSNQAKNKFTNYLLDTNIVCRNGNMANVATPYQTGLTNDGYYNDQLDKPINRLPNESTNRFANNQPINNQVNNYQQSNQPNRTNQQNRPQSTSGVLGFINNSIDRYNPFSQSNNPQSTDLNGSNRLPNSSNNQLGYQTNYQQPNALNNNQRYPNVPELNNQPINTPNSQDSFIKPNYPITNNNSRPQILNSIQPSNENNLQSNQLSSN